MVLRHLVERERDLDKVMVRTWAWGLEDMVRTWAWV